MIFWSKTNDDAASRFGDVSSWYQDMRTVLCVLMQKRDQSALGIDDGIDDRANSVLNKGAKKRKECS